MQRPHPACSNRLLREFVRALCSRAEDIAAGPACPSPSKGVIGRQAAGGLSLYRIGEPEDQVVQVRPAPGEYRAC